VTVARGIPMACRDVLYGVKKQIARLTIKHHHTDGAKETGRAFNAKEDARPEKF